MESPYFSVGPKAMASPVFLSVPHAGRHYPAAMDRLCRLSSDQLRHLEDAHADQLTKAATAAGHNAMIANFARAWIDLNRTEDEIDPGMIIMADRTRLHVRTSAKVKGGLGLIPRRIAQGGDLWRSPLTAADVEERLETVHRPYHQALATALEDRRALFGTAILIDLHSMPSLRPDGPEKPPHIVVGDLFRRSAHTGFTGLVQAEIEAAGFRTALNTPYAGGAILDRHARPHRGIHAIQIEVDRALYLDSEMKTVTPGAAAIGHLIRRVADRLRDAIVNTALPLAAE